jgi:hypothetical protein
MAGGTGTDEGVMLSRRRLARKLRMRFEKVRLAEEMGMPFVNGFTTLSWALVWLRDNRQRFESAARVRMAKGKPKKKDQAA